MRFTVTTLTEGKVLVTKFLNRDEAWEAMMALGRLPEVKHVSLEPVADHGAWRHRGEDHVRNS